MKKGDGTGILKTGPTGFRCGTCNAGNVENVLKNHFLYDML